MTVEYQKVWRTMNDLEVVTSKICSAREIIDAAIDRIQEHQYDKAEMMMSAAYEYLEYYLQEFDDKFKLAWQATVGDLRDGDVRNETLTCDKNDPSPECQGAWNDFWEEHYYPEEHQQYTEEELNAMCNAAEKTNKVKKWILTIEQNPENFDYYVILPDGLLEAAKLKEGDELNWVDNGDGSFKIVKVTKPLGMDDC